MNNLFYGLRIVSGLSSLKYTFSLHPLKMYICFPPPPLFSPIFLCFYFFSCSFWALLTFPRLHTNSNAEIYFFYGMLWQGFARKAVAAGRSLQQIVVTAGWSHYLPANPCLAALWFSFFSDGIFHQAELTSVRRQKHLLLCPGRLPPSPAQQCLRKSEEPHGNNYH